MKVFHRNTTHFPDQKDSEQNNDSPKAATFRYRWEAFRYGPVGRVVGYCAAFIVAFLLITLLLWTMESYRF